MEDIIPILLGAAIILSIIAFGGFLIEEENCYLQVAEVVCKTCELSNWTGSIWAGKYGGLLNCSDLKESCTEVFQSK